MAVAPWINLRGTSGSSDRPSLRPRQARPTYLFSSCPATTKLTSLARNSSLSRLGWEDRRSLERYPVHSLRSYRPHQQRCRSRIHSDSQTSRTRQDGEGWICADVHEAIMEATLSACHVTHVSLAIATLLPVNLI
jgi:hypothetical protein